MFTQELAFYVALGFAAQLVDGALGMAYGLIATSALLASGAMPAVASASVHAAEMVTTGLAGASHAWHRNIDWALVRRLAPAGVLGGVVGAYILTVPNNDAFRKLVPWLLLFATLLFAASPKIVALARAIGKSEGHHPSTKAWAAGLAFQTGVAVYGGFFGAGMGIVMLAALAITEGDDFHLINSAKHLCSTLIQLVAVVLFIAAGLVSWPETLIVGAASVIGGYLGVVFGRRLPANVIRWLVIAVGVVLTLYFFIR